MTTLSLTDGLAKGTTIAGPTGSTSAASKSMSVNTSVVMQQIGTDTNALDTASMQAQGLGSTFQDFDLTNVTPAQLGLVSKNLLALGLISDTTATQMVEAGTDLDSTGNHTAPDAPFNALDYFASRINNLNTATTGGNKYADQVLPDYINTVHVLQDLDAFAKNANAAASRVDTTA